MKFMILGYARCGKDTAAAFLCKQYGLTFESSSHFCGELAVRPALARLGYEYPDIDTMFAQRELVPDWRRVWHEAIAEYNSPDKTKLGRELFAQYDIYCGLRSAEEFKALKAQRVFDFSIWIDASRRIPPEPKTSMQIEPQMADYMVGNNHTIPVMLNQLTVLMGRLGYGNKRKSG